MESSELMVILEQLERDKGIQKDVLIEAVESAVASAAKKLWTVNKNEDIKVVLDRLTGKLTAYAGDQEIRSSEFGRIAAQTAKQVVIQKIREAEKDVVFDEYQQKIGQIISGSVYRFDKGTIIIDLVKAEACIPRSEQSHKEEFKQGDRIRAYVLEIKRENRGPQIILSRANPVFVKRLFELEVPEIYEGIVEIKSISRDVGERTKIAVYSKDEKVDSVGACVGMRGSRVKNIVTELQGEKIDIVRYSSDIKEFIQAALSPAEISQIQLDYDEKKANIIVADDQLSLAIGKKGQNVRLASKLVGWDLDLFTFKQWEELDETSEEESSEDVVDSPQEAVSEDVSQEEVDNDEAADDAVSDVAEEAEQEATEESEVPDAQDEAMEEVEEEEDQSQPEENVEEAEAGEDAEEASAKETVEEAAEETIEEAVEEAPVERVESDLMKLSSVSDKLIESLINHGFESIEKVAQANVDDLTQIKGLGKIKAEKLIDEAKNFTAE